MLGLVMPEQGEVLFQGERITQANAALLARVLGWDSPRREARLATLCELARLPASALDAFPRELSGGQAQRVALMRALMLDPDVLLLDEPLGALDPHTRFELQTDLKRVFEEVRKTVVLVTHDLPEAYFFGDVWAVIQDGGCVQCAPPGEVLTRPVDSFVSRFLLAQRPFPTAAEAR
jgi:osmoprotectant transport system ATP-binding protein